MLQDSKGPTDCIPDDIIQKKDIYRFTILEIEIFFENKCFTIKVLKLENPVSIRFIIVIVGVLCRLEKRV